MMSTYSWLQKHKALIVYGAALALSVALTACSKGFQVEVKEQTLKKGTVAVVPASAINSKSLNAIAAAYNQEAAAYLKSLPANTVADIKAQAILNLKNLSFSNAELLGRDSMVTLLLQLKTEKKTIEITVQSSNAIIALGHDKPVLSESGTIVHQGTGQVTISGYWTLDARDQWGNPMLIGLNSMVQRTEDNNLKVNGELTANVDRADVPQQLATFQDVGLCSINPDTAWTWDAYQQGGIDCPVDYAF